jgi:FAD binding domain/Berberine and berberine like
MQYGTRSLELLQRQVGASVVTPASPTYDQLRRVYNGMIDCRPSVMVLCHSRADVQATVRYANDAGLPLAIRGSGHNVAGLGTLDDGVVAIMAMRDIAVDSHTRRATVGAGATWGELDAATHSLALATTGGIVHDTGVSGLTLGGGLGWLMGVAGLACDNLLAVHIVFADASTTHVDDASHPDLMWALRGGGGNFGAVTSLEFSLLPVSTVYAGSIRVSLSRATEALLAFAAFAADCPDWLTVSPALLVKQPFGAHLSFDLCSVGDEQQTIEAVAPLAVGEGLLESTIRRQPYPAWQRTMSDPYRRGRRSYWKSVSLDRLTEDVVRAIVRSFEVVPSPHTLITIDHVHGRALRVAPADTAYGVRRPFVLLINSNWGGASEDRANTGWTRTLFSDISKQYDIGGPAYVNYLDRDDGARIAESYGGNLTRLTQVKNTYDPHNVFRQNYNVRPGVVPATESATPSASS